jgi:hypothetical protein
MPKNAANLLPGKLTNGCLFVCAVTIRQRPDEMFLISSGKFIKQEYRWKIVKIKIYLREKKS